jgi:hypothetical protein
VLNNPTPETVVQPGTPDPNASIIQSIESNPNAQPATVQGTGEGELPVAPPGTLVSSATEDPGAAQVFDQIVATQSGGATNMNRFVQVFKDGTVVRDDTRTTVSQEQITAVDTMLDEINFFGLQGAFLGPASDPNSYRYTLTVIRGETERMIQAQDGFMPAELERLLATVLGLGAPTGP